MAHCPPQACGQFHKSQADPAAAAIIQTCVTYQVQTFRSSKQDSNLGVGDGFNIHNGEVSAHYGMLHNAHIK